MTLFARSDCPSRCNREEEKGNPGDTQQQQLGRQISVGRGVRAN